MSKRLLNNNLCNILLVVIPVVILSTIALTYYGGWIKTPYKKDMPNYYLMDPDDIQSKELAAVYMMTIFPLDSEELQKDILEKAKSFIMEEQIDVVIVSEYLTHALKIYPQNQEILPILELFYENAADNSLPSYYLSYYYQLHGNEQLATQYFLQGNDINNLDRYSDEKKALLYQHFTTLTGDSDLAYGLSSGFILEYDIPYGRLLGQLLENESISPEDVYHFADIFGRSSETFGGNLIFIGMKTLGAKKEKNKELMSKLEKERENLKELFKKFSSCKLTEEQSSSYLKDIYYHGDVEAMKKHQCDLAHSQL